MLMRMRFLKSNGLSCTCKCLLVNRLVLLKLRCSSLVNRAITCISDMVFSPVRGKLNVLSPGKQASVSNDRSSIPNRSVMFQRETEDLQSLKTLNLEMAPVALMM